MQKEVVTNHDDFLFSGNKVQNPQRTIACICALIV